MKFSWNAKAAMLGEIELKSFVIFGTRNGMHVGFVIDRHERTTGVVHIPIGGDEEPHYTRFSGGLLCLTFGADCLITPIGIGEGLPSRPWDKAGQITVTEEGSYITAITREGSFPDISLFGISEGTGSCDVPQHHMSFSRWEVWASEQERLSPKGEPLFVYTVKLPEA